MMIKAILRGGLIQPLEPLPPDWTDGQALVVEEPESPLARTKVDQWASDLDAAVAELPAEEHDRFRQALGEIEQEGKDAVRREWGLS